MINVGPADWLASRLSLCNKNFNVAIFWDTINMINVKLCTMIVLIELYPFTPLSVTLIVFHFYVTAVSNSFNCKFYVLFQWSWNFVQLLTTSSRSWIYHYFWVSHIFKGDNWHIVWVGDIDQLVEHWTGMLLKQVRFPNVARDFSLRVNFQWRLSYGNHPHALTSVRTLKIL